jgi:hypothetical protein
VKKPGGSSLVQDEAGTGSSGTPGKRTLVEQLQASMASGDSSAQGVGAAASVVQRQATTGGKPPEETEKVGASLYATDDKGNELPPTIGDVKQGGLNDCYAFAAMAAIVHSDPDRIKSMIQDNGNGTYTVTFQGTGFFSSDTQTVTADFVKGKHGKVGARNVYWPLVIERAYGQNKGGIAEMDKGGNAGTAIDDFVNMGPSRFDPREKDNDYIMAKLAKADRQEAHHARYAQGRRRFEGEEGNVHQDSGPPFLARLRRGGGRREGQASQAPQSLGIRSPQRRRLGRGRRHPHLLRRMHDQRLIRCGR